MQIVASDFDKDRALSVNGKNYCQKCRKEAPVPATAAGGRAPGSDRVSATPRPSQTGSRVLDAITPPPSARKVVTPPPRRSGSTPPPRRAGGTTRIRKPALGPGAPNRMPLIVGGAIGAVILLAIIVKLALGGDPPKENNNASSGTQNPGGGNGSSSNHTDVTPPKSDDARLWDELQAFDGLRPDEPGEVLSRFRRGREKMTEQKYKDLADRRIAELEKKVEDEKVDEQLGLVLFDIDKLTPEDDLPKIVDLLAAAEEQVAGGEARRKKLDGVRAEITSRLNSILPKRIKETTGYIEAYVRSETYSTAASEIRDLLVFLKAAETLTDTSAEQGRWTEKLKEIEKLDEAASSKPPDKPKPPEVEAGPWTALFDGKLSGWEALQMDASGEWKLDGGALVGTRPKDGKGQYGAGYGRQDVVLTDFDMEIDIEVTKGTAYVVQRATLEGGRLNGGLVQIPKGERMTIKVRTLGREQVIDSSAAGTQRGRLTDNVADAGGLMLLLGEESEARIHSIRYRDLR